MIDLCRIRDNMPRMGKPMVGAEKSEEIRIRCSAGWKRLALERARRNHRSLSEELRACVIEAERADEERARKAG
jgi:hypothetical protein